MLDLNGESIFTVMSKLAKKHDAINLSQGFPDFPISEDLEELMRSRVSQPIHQYAPSSGLPLLINHLAADYSKRYQCQLTEQNITIVPGATYGIYTALSTVLGKDDEVIVLTPAYDSYIPNIESMGAKVTSVPLHMDTFLPDWNEINAAFSSKTKAIVINTPHNPTGTIWSEDDWTNLEFLAQKYFFYIISDEVYEHLTFDGKQHHSILTRPSIADRYFAVYSFGKSLHITGWKIGYVIAPEILTKNLRKRHQYIAFSSSHFIQDVIYQYLILHTNLNLQLKSFFQNKRDLMISALETSEWKIPFISSGTYFQLLDYSNFSSQDDLKMVHDLVKFSKVAAIPLSPFFNTPFAGKYLRFCFAKKDETLTQAIELLRNKFPL